MDREDDEVGGAAVALTRELQSAKYFKTMDAGNARVRTQCSPPLLPSSHHSGAECRGRRRRRATYLLKRTADLRCKFGEEEERRDRPAFFLPSAAASFPTKEQRIAAAPTLRTALQLHKPRPVVCTLTFVIIVDASRWMLTQINRPIIESIQTDQSMNMICRIIDSASIRCRPQ